jgi:hypothetical protein
MDVAKASATSVDRYNPAEDWPRSPKPRDLEGLRNALTDKLTYQRNVVIWWDN